MRIPQAVHRSVGQWYGYIKFADNSIIECDGDDHFVEVMEKFGNGRNRVVALQEGEPSEEYCLEVYHRGHEMIFDTPKELNSFLASCKL